MKLNQKIPYIQGKRHIKINKYYLKSLQDTYSKNTHKGARQKQSTSKQKKKTQCCQQSVLRFPTHRPRTMWQPVNFDKIQKTGFHKTGDKRARNLITDSSN